MLFKPNIHWSLSTKQTHKNKQIFKCFTFKLIYLLISILFCCILNNNMITPFYVILLSCSVAKQKKYTTTINQSTMYYFTILFFLQNTYLGSSFSFCFLSIIFSNFFNISYYRRLFFSYIFTSLSNDWALTMTSFTSLL